MDQGQMIRRFLKEAGIAVKTMEVGDVWEAQRCWRSAFATAIKNQTGKWMHAGADWHTFSYGFAQHMSGFRAEDAFDRVGEEGPYVVLWGCNPVRGLACQGPLPEASSWHAFLDQHTWAFDLYIFSADAKWTMVFTHEARAGLGPYFSCRDWQGGMV